MPGLLRCTCGDYARVLHLNFAREAAGALGTRHSLRPLFLREAKRFVKTRAPRAAGRGSLVVSTTAPHPQSSSPGLTGRPSIPETPVMESRSRGVLDTPLEPVIGLAEGETRWRGMTALRGAARAPLP